MPRSHRQGRSCWVACVAIWGMFLAVAGVVEASRTGDRQSESAGIPRCCACRSENCNKSCCKTTVVVPSQTDTDQSAIRVRLISSQTACSPIACQCHASEPIAPDPKPIRRTVEDRCECGEDLASACMGPVLDPASAHLASWDVGDRLNRPLQLLTTHLRF